MYSTLTKQNAKNETTAHLISAMNECRPESGAYLVAQAELKRRYELDASLRKIGLTIVLGVIAFVFWLLKK